MRRLVFVFLLSLSVTAIHAQQPVVQIAPPANRTASGALGALNATVVINAEGSGGIKWEIDTGTLSGTVVFEGTLDDSTWFAVNAIRIDGTIIASTTSFGDRGAFTSVSYSRVRLRVSVYTSGTSNARLEASTGGEIIRLGQELPAGTATIGAVNLAQYTPVSGRVPVDGSGVTQPVSGTVTANAGTGTFATDPTDDDARVLGRVKIHDGTDVALVSAGGALLVDGSATTQPVSGTVTVTDGAGALNVIVDSSALPTGASTLAEQQTQTTALQLIDDAVSTTGSAVPAKGVQATGTDGTLARALKTDTSGELQVDVLTLPSVTIGTFPDNEPINVAQIAGTATSVNNGTTDAGTQRVTLASDGTGEVRVADDAGNQIPSATSGPATNARGLNTRAVHDDPCATVLATPLAISVTANTQLVALSGSTHVYVCHLNLVVAAATNVAIVSGTGSVCGTSTAGVMGGATAATGWNFAANGGIATGGGGRTIARTETAGDALCIFVSAANQVSGSIMYVQQ